MLRIVDPQAREQPCGRHSRPIMVALDATLHGGVDEPAHPFGVHLGPIETPAAVWTTQERPSLRNYSIPGFLKKTWDLPGF